MAHIPGMIRAMAAVPRVHLADPQANAQEILALLRQADEQRAELCVFPELCLCGYTCADLLLHPPLLAGCLQALETLLRAPVRAAFVVGLPLEIGGRLYNCAAAVCGGRILGVVPKAHLPNSGEFYEKRWFEPGASAPESMTLCGQSVPVGGDLVFDGGRFSFGIELCEDLWVPAPPSARLCMGGALMIGGASSNVCDHLTRGYVVDYLKFALKPLRNVVFNISDFCIFIGSFLILIGAFFFPES